MVIIAHDDSVGMRIDAFLAKSLVHISRARLQNLIVEGHVLSDGRKVRSSSKIKGGEQFVVDLPEPRSSQLLAQDLPLTIIHEDDDIIVINKPAGLVVHPGAGNLDGTLVNALLHRYPDMTVGDVKRPGLVHRLDKDTSGVMVCAKHDIAYQFLVNAFKSRRVEKIYRAFCVGSFRDRTFELQTGHARHKTDRKRFTTKMPAGTRLAHSRFEVLAMAGGVAELRVQLLTGRTHQIRAHLADIGRPLLHDELYGGVKAQGRLPASPVRAVADELTRHALHSERLTFEHPSRHVEVVFQAELPPDLQRLHDVLNG
jgi:23S rRNA pseudouridine1911/1915/1917 synthase